MTLWSLAALLLAGVYCISRAVADLRLRKYGWGIFGIFSVAVLLLTPIETHAVKFDLLPVSPRGP